MKRLLLISLITLVCTAGCTSPENEGGTAIPAAQTGAPLADEAVGPSDQQTKIGE